MNCKKNLNMSNRLMCWNYTGNNKKEQFTDVVIALLLCSIIIKVYCSLFCGLLLPVHSTKNC